MLCAASFSSLRLLLFSSPPPHEAVNPTISHLSFHYSIYVPPDALLPAFSPLRGVLPAWFVCPSACPPVRPDCLEHQPKTEFDWECPERLVSIMDLLVKPRAFDEHEMEITTDFSAVNTESLMRVHSGPYIKFVDSLGKKLEVSKMLSVYLGDIMLTICFPCLLTV